MNKYESAIDAILNLLQAELAPTLYYHGLYHTNDVIEAARVIGNTEGVSNAEMNLLEVAAAYHDCGHLVTYANHEEASCGIAYAMLKSFGFSQSEINVVCQMIMATKIPQNPKSKLDQILCDADLDYLGRDDYKSISSELYKEFCEWGILCGEKKWTERQIAFLSQHMYWTTYSIENREISKRKQLAVLQQKLSSL